MAKFAKFAVGDKVSWCGKPAVVGTQPFADGEGDLFYVVTRPSDQGGGRGHLAYEDVLTAAPEYRPGQLVTVNNTVRTVVSGPHRTSEDGVAYLLENEAGECQLLWSGYIHK